MHSFTDELLSLANEDYKSFNQKLIPDIKCSILGVKIPIIKAFAKDVYKNNIKEVNLFLEEQHTYHEEWLLHGFLISLEKNFDIFIDKVNNFLPNIDNWAVCDCSVMAMKLFKQHPQKGLIFAKNCLKSLHPYTIRFGIVLLLCYYLDKNFSKEVIDCLLQIKSENYYVNMGLAWFYSVALIKQYDSVINIFKNKELSKFIHNKSIQKAIESFRTPQEIKNYLKTIKIK